MSQIEATQDSGLDRILSKRFPISVEMLLVLAVVLLAVFSRFYMLGARVMSHDEVNHVTPAYDLYRGLGYRYDPMSHGPLQFHLMAWSYFLFGDSDLSSRLPHALFSVATVVVILFLYRRYLGRAGSLLAGLMVLVSPYMLFYGRYARNEAFIVLWGALTLYAILRYLETGENWTLFLFTAVNALHSVDKATSYIFAGEQLLFLGCYLVLRIGGRNWQNPKQRRQFLALVGVALAFTALILGTGLGGKAALVLVAAGVLVCGTAAVLILVRGVGWDTIRNERSFDLLILLATLILPLLAALPVKLLGFSPLDTSSAGILRAMATFLVLAILAIAAGLWWNPSRWPLHAALFYLPFVTFYTTFFRHGAGFAAGVMGALGYWMEQQAVNRGGQPWFYYAFLQVPLYEFLPALGALLAFFIGVRERLWQALPGQPFRRPLAGDREGSFAAEAPDVASLPVPTLTLLLYWSLSSLVLFTFAGEKMPWLTTNIALPLILSAGWAMGYVLENQDWHQWLKQRGWLVLLLLPLFLASMRATLSTLLTRPQVVPGIQANATLWTSAIVAIGTAWACFQILKDWTTGQIGRTLAVLAFLFLAVLTVRTAVRAAFINYDNAKEYLVYAHAAGDPKYALAQIEDLSHKTTGGLDIVVAYDNDVRYPYWWYLRHYPNRIDYDVNPTRDIRRAAVVLAAEANYGKVEAIVGQDYQAFDYMRMWWPNQDYERFGWDAIAAELASPSASGQTPKMSLFRYAQGLWRRLKPFLLDSRSRSAIWQIWLNRDYTQYAALQNRNDFTLENWNTASRMRMYLRKDILAKVYGAGSATTAPTEDPYAKRTVTLQPDQIIGGPGNGPGQLQSPRGIAVAPDGSLYVADSRNHRIQHFSKEGTALAVWGTFADASKGDAPGGTFNEPWGIAVGSDGSVFVADTWNHRVQKFTPDGHYLTMWGNFGLGDSAFGLWGPRGLATDTTGRVYVADTGNKRVIVFDADGNYVTEFGGAGTEPGQFNEPVGVAADASGQVYVADTWNQRMQVLTPDSAGTTFSPLFQWPVSAWYGQSVENKPFVATNRQNHVFVTDPEGYRVLEFTNKGEIVRLWGQYSEGPDGFGLPAGITADADGIWVSDARNHRLLHFAVPVQ